MYANPATCTRALIVGGSTRHAQLGFSGVDEKAVDSASLQRVTDLKAFRLVRKGSDLQAVEGAEIAYVSLFNMRLKPGELLVLLGDLFPEPLRLGLRARGAKLQPVIATTGRRHGHRRTRRRYPRFRRGACLRLRLR